ncbi:DUF2157 domain-containing protein [Salidesulfovibrio brasiliensis]|uniref:DUF2157 domain-containing protein n=1 Tax=Salidesulfovibrio brasiliensis TaxID=221711 RepID=UPI0006CFEE0E|nr:DUF2157 domain-containing protein [Salidesulfovibrio brasiliensis]
MTEETTSKQAADRPLRPKDVDTLYQGGVISHARRMDDLALAGWQPRWDRWLDVLLLVAGAGLLLSGIIFFFAWNWDDMHRFLKLGLVLGGVIACTGAAVFMDMDSRAGRALLAGAGVLVGVFFAVFGQVYQTGADAWEMFRIWTLLLLPWALAGRSSALWLLVVLLGNTWGLLWLAQEAYLFDRDWFSVIAASACLALYLLMDIVGRRLTDYGRWRGWQYLFLVLPLFWICWSSWVAVSEQADWLFVALVPLLAGCLVMPVLRRDAAGMVLCLFAFWNLCIAAGVLYMVKKIGLDPMSCALLGMISLSIPVIGIVRIKGFVQEKEEA